MVIGALVLVFLVGCVLTTVGLRGRLVSRAPHCRACRFDVSGIEGKCPECGSELGAPGAVMPGLRRRRPRMLTVGLALVVCGVLGGGAYGYGRAKGFNWNTIKPAWLLIRELESSSPGTSGAA